MTVIGFRGLRGGSWQDFSGLDLSNRYIGSPDGHDTLVGFRVATIIPEPNSIVLFVLGATASMLRGRRK